MSHGSRPTIFVVDDDDGVRDSLKALLETRHFSVVDFESGEAFLQGSNDTATGCLILDIHMPGMSGLDVLRTLRTQGDLLPVILVTGRRDAAAKAQAEALGALTLLDKPISSPALFAAIDHAFGGVQPQ